METFRNYITRLKDNFNHPSEFNLKSWYHKSLFLPVLLTTLALGCRDAQSNQHISPENGQDNPPGTYFDPEDANDNSPIVKATRPSSYTAPVATATTWAFPPQAQITPGLRSRPIPEYTLPETSEILTKYVEPIKTALLFGPELSGENTMVTTLGLENPNLYKLFTTNSLDASIQDRWIPLWEVQSSSHDRRVINLFKEAHHNLLGKIPPRKQKLVMNIWQRDLLSRLGGSGFNPFLVNYDYYFYGLGEASIMIHNTPRVVKDWEEFTRLYSQLTSEERLNALNKYKELLDTTNPTLSEQLSRDEESKLLALYQAVYGLSKIGIYSEVSNAPLTRELGNLLLPLKPKIDIESVEFSSKYYAHGTIWQEDTPPPYYNQMLEQLLSRNLGLSAPYCPMVGGCEVIPGKDLGNPATYQIQGLHSGVDFYPTGDNRIIAPLGMWVIQADGTNGFYGLNPRTGQPIGHGEHAVIGYLGDFAWNFRDGQGTNHTWVGDVFLNFAHVEPSYELRTYIEGGIDPHQVAAVKVLMGQEIAFLGSSGYGSNPHLHFEVLVSWRTRDDVSTDNPNPNLNITRDGRPSGLRYIQGSDGVWYVQTGNIFEQIAERPVPLVAQYQWPYGPDVDFIKFWEMIPSQ